MLFSILREISFKGKLDIIDSKGKISGILILDMSTINCTDLEGEWKQKLEGHLKSDDFFSVEKYPFASFEIKNSYKLKVSAPKT